MGKSVLVFVCSNGRKQAVHSILITSASAREGKSTTVTNLATVLAQMGYKTLVIDADLRRPILHRIFGLEKRPGITEVVSGTEAVEDVIQTSAISNLDVITCGTLPPNPSEVLGAPGMKHLLSELKSRYQIVLLDSPPVLPVTDAQVLATLVDSVLIVTKFADTKRDAMKQAHLLLNNVKAQVLGVVLNGVRRERMYGSYYYYYQDEYYSDNGQDSRKKRRKSRKKESSGFSF